MSACSGPSRRADVRDLEQAVSAYQPDSLNAHLAHDDSGREHGDLLGLDDPDLELAGDRLALHALLPQLPQREQTLLAMRFYGGKSQTEIATHLGISQMHVSRLMHASLAWLRAAMLTDRPPTARNGNEQPELTVTVHAGQHVIRAAVSGEIDRDNVAHLRTQLAAALRRCRRDQVLRIALDDVPLIDAVGITVLINLHEAGQGRTVRFTGVQPAVARALIAAHAGHLLPNHPPRTA